MKIVPWQIAMQCDQNARTLMIEEQDVRLGFIDTKGIRGTHLHAICPLCHSPMYLPYNEVPLAIEREARLKFLSHHLRTVSVDHSESGQP